MSMNTKKTMIECVGCEIKKERSSLYGERIDDSRAGGGGTVCCTVPVVEGIRYYTQVPWTLDWRRIVYRYFNKSRSLDAVAMLVAERLPPIQREQPNQNMSNNTNNTMETAGASSEQQAAPPADRLYEQQQPPPAAATLLTATGFAEPLPMTTKLDATSGGGPEHDDEPEEDGMEDDDEEDDEDDDEDEETAAAVLVATAEFGSRSSNAGSGQPPNKRRRTGGKKRARPWNDMLFELLKFRFLHGNVMVPFKSGGDLGKWVAVQRAQYMSLQKSIQAKHENNEEESKKWAHTAATEGGSERLTEERMKVLSSIGFVWDVVRNTLGASSR